MTTTLDNDLSVETFASAVRGELFDLDSEVIDDLTDGLEADLADKLADGDTLGDPTVYAAELRAAAGLDPRGRRRNMSGLDAAAKGVLVEIRDGAKAFIGRHPWIGAIVVFFSALQPLWWVLRAWLLFCLLFTNWAWYGIPSDSPGWWVLAALVVLSVQWGRRRWLPWRWSRGAVVVASVILVLAAPFVLSTPKGVSEINPGDSDGILLNGQQVTNIFAYGADGQPLTDVQLFDQNGNPLVVVPDGNGSYIQWDGTLGGNDALVPSDSVAGKTGWNVYPLESVPYSSIDPNTGQVYSWAKRSAVEAPFASVQRLLDNEDAAPTPTPAP
jgi:hypothetical protein